MDGRHFDDLTKELASDTSRRRLLGVLAAGLAGAFAGALPGARGVGLDRAAAAACRDTGRRCAQDGNCCSGLCDPGSRTCVCPPGQESCRGSCLSAAAYQSDPANCGGCGVGCPSGRSCSGGQCVDDCVALGQRDCGGVCVLAAECCPGEERACYSGPAGTAGVGACHAGVQSCQSNGLFGPCEGQVVPQPETCNDRDDDCDGSTDEGDLCGPNALCQVGACVDCPGGQSACNGLCVDLQSNEQHCGACGNGCGDGQPCVNGVCSCEGEGTPCDTGQFGVCAAGVIQCFGNFARCMPITPPSAEVCNGLDDDCDGEVDELVFCPGIAVGEICQSDGIGDARCCYSSGAPAPISGLIPDCDRCCSGDCDFFGLCE